MAGFAGIAAAGKSIEMLLNAGFDELQPLAPAPPGKKTKAVLIRTIDFDITKTSTSISLPGLSIFLYRVDFNKAMRAAWSATSEQDGRTHLALDLHYLMTPWAENADDEHKILGRTMQCLEATPILTGPLLHAAGEWDPAESIQIVMEEVSSEAVLRMFDSLPTDYRLSAPYIARVMRLDGIRVPEGARVITAITGITPTTNL